MEIRGNLVNLERIRYLLLSVFLAVHFKTSSSQDLNDDLSSTPGLPTVTVRGFLNFKTTVDGTVIVFTPASDLQHPATQQKMTKPSSDMFHSSAAPNTAFIPKDDFKEKQLNDGVQDISYASPPQNSLDTIKTELPNLNLLENNMKEPFLQHISDNAVLPSTGHINNDLEKVKKNQASINQYPTGLVTILGGTFVVGTSTTVYETKVIGTYIDGKYAQILQSTSHVVSQPTSYITVSPKLGYSMTGLDSNKEQLGSSSVINNALPHSFSVASISTQSLPSKSSIPISPSKSSIHNVPKTSILNLPSKSATPNLPLKSLISSQPSKSFISSQISKSFISSQPSKSFVSSQPSKSLMSGQPSKSLTFSLPSKSISSSQSEKSFTIMSTPTLRSPENAESISIVEKMKSYVQKTNINPSQPVTKRENIASFSTFKPKYQTSLESSFITKSVTVSFDNEQPTESLESAMQNTFSKVRSSFIPLTTTVVKFAEDETLHKNYRNNTSRTRFLSPRRPSQSVRLNRFKVKLTLRHDSADEYNVTLPTDDEELEEDYTNKAEEEIEVVTEGYGMGVDPAKVVFQETTITSEVTLYVGRRKSVRTLTITTSIPLTVHPTDIQDILAAESTSMEKKGSEADPFNHIVTRTFTTTERALKTSVVPVFDGKSTAYHTVTESFFIMKIITAYRTLPSGDASVLESIFEEPEISITTLEAAANIQPSVIQSAPPDQFLTEDEIQPSMTLPSIQNIPLQNTNPFLSLGHALSHNPLAAVYLGLQQLNAQMTLYSTVTDTSTYVTTETFYNSKTIRFYDGRSTRYRTVSDPTSTKKKTVTTTITSVQPYLNTHALQQQQQLQKLIGATRLTPEQHFSTLTSIYTTVTTTASLSTRIYTLIYNGFSTKFRTVISTSMYPATVTVTSTTKVPIIPTNVPFAYPYST